MSDFWAPGAPAGLPPGQAVARGFPRFGISADRPPPKVPSHPVIEIGGAVSEPLEFGVAELSGMVHKEITADFSCVAGWTAKDQRWGGVPFAEFYREVIEARTRPESGINYVSFIGLDGFGSVLLLEDALSDDVLLADYLDGSPLGDDHGAPVRLLSPGQYAYKNTKHLCRIELHVSEPREAHASRKESFMIGVVKPHLRARIALEERHRYLPAWSVRWVYRHIIFPSILFVIKRGERRNRIASGS